jgi:HSP20 family protein
MAFRDLIPWNRGREVTVRRDEDVHPFVTLHREMNRLFEDTFRGSGLAPFSGLDRLMNVSAWPHLEVSESDREITIAADLPGLDEKDVQVELANGVLSIRGEKKTETEDKDRLMSERYYGRFERRIPIDDADPEKVTASFKKGVLTVVMPKTEDARRKVRRIAINGHKHDGG